jgi:uncharacterized protein (DUF1778 family)
MAMRRSEAPSRVLAIRLSPQEQAQLRTAARVNRQSLSGFIRETALAEANEFIEDQPVTAIVIRTR